MPAPPKIVRLPDGSVIEFPGDMDDARISQALAGFVPKSKSAPSSTSAPEAAFDFASGLFNRTVVPAAGMLRAGLSGPGGAVAADLERRLRGEPPPPGLLETGRAASEDQFRKMYALLEAAKSEPRPEATDLDVAMGFAAGSPGTPLPGGRSLSEIEAMGRGVAGFLPFIGPSVADSAAKLATADAATGTGELTGDVLMALMGSRLLPRSSGAVPLTPRGPGFFDDLIPKFKVSSPESRLIPGGALESEAMVPAAAGGLRPKVGYSDILGPEVSNPAGALTSELYVKLLRKGHTPVGIRQMTPAERLAAVGEETAASTAPTASTAAPAASLEAQLAQMLEQAKSGKSVLRGPDIPPAPPAAPAPGVPAELLRTVLGSMAGAGARKALNSVAPGAGWLYDLARVLRKR